MTDKIRLNLFSACLKGLVFLAVCSPSVLTSCSSGDDAGGGSEKSDMPLIIFDTDLGSSTDDLFALEMLHRYQDEGRCKILGVIVDREGEENAACANVLNTYFGHSDIPIGLERSGVDNPQVFVDYGYIATLKTPDGRPLFPSADINYSQLSDGWRLYRQLLAAQPDYSVSICSVGFVTCLAQLLASQPDDISPLSGIELVRRKVKCLYIMAGYFESTDMAEYNLYQSLDFAQTFFDLWPDDVDMLFSPQEVGAGIDYLQEQVLDDLMWATNHPIKFIHENLTIDSGQRMWDPLVVIQAVEGDEPFSLSERGNVTITSRAVTVFTPSGTGNCRYQLPGSTEWRAMMLQKIRMYNRMR